MAIPAWLDGFAHVDLDRTGIQAPEVGRPYDEQSHPKICLHTTEGGSIEGAERSFAAYPPHVGVEYRRRLRRQYLPLDHCSFSLKGSESDDEFVVQVEIVGLAAAPPTGDEADWIGAAVIAPIARAIGCPLVAPPQGFHGPGEGLVLALTTSPIRFRTEAQLRAFSGVMGHQHAPPPDTHWDPGRIDIARILAAARQALNLTPTPITLTEDDDDMADYVLQAPGRPATHLVAGKMVKLPDGQAHAEAVASVKTSVGDRVLDLTTEAYDAYDRLFEG
jgi:hypothetical protein